MRIDRGRSSPRQHVGDVLLHAGVQAGRGNAKAHGLAVADRIDRQRAAARNGLWAMTSMFNSSLTRFFGSNSRGKFQLMVILPSSIWPRAMVWAVAEINLRAGRSRRAKRQAAELQPRRGRLGALADSVEREFAIFGLRIVVEQPQAH